MTGERLVTPPHWAELLETALTLPGHSSGTYSRFRTLSLGNQALLMIQKVFEPVNTFKGWKALGRHVTKGSKAKVIYVPMFRKEKNDKGEVEEKLSGFKLVPCMFGVSETEGEDLPPWEPPTWSKELALETLDITEVKYEMIDANVQGYSYQRNVAINPLARYPFKTLIHEIAHVTHGHTTGEVSDEYKLHRGLGEFEAESAAYLVMNELDVLDKFDAAESRHYIQTWLQGETPPDASIKRVFTVADKIIKAGREEAVELAEAS